MKGLLLLTGEAFRQGLQTERKRDTKNGISAHVDFCDYLKEKHGVKMDVSINTYDTIHDTR